MSTLTIIIMIAFLVLFFRQLWLNKSKRPVTLVFLYVQIFAALGLMLLIWLGSEGRIEYRILLTVIAISSLIQSVVSYKRQNGTNS